MRSKIEITKTVVSFIVGVGATRIAKAIIDNNTEDEEKLHNRVAINSASLVLGAMAAERAKDYTDAKIDEIVEFWDTKIKPRL